eukprot:2376457-Alexandrium_andersonii.AAC.1
MASSWACSSSLASASHLRAVSSGPFGPVPPESEGHGPPSGDGRSGSHSQKCHMGTGSACALPTRASQERAEAPANSRVIHLSHRLRQGCAGCRYGKVHAHHQIHDRVHAAR